MSGDKVLFNTSAQLIGRFIGAALGFITTLLLARLLGAFYFGEYTKITTYLALFYLWVDFGMNTIYLQVLSEQKMLVEKTLPSFMGLRLLFGLILAGVCVVGGLSISFFTGGFSNLVVIGIVLGTPSILLYGVQVTVIAFLQKKHRYDLATVADVAGSAATLVFVWALSIVKDMHMQNLVLGALATLIAGMLVTALFSLRYMLINDIPLLPHRNDRLWKNIFKRSLPLGLVLLFNIIYFRIDTIILSAFRTSAEIGSYGLAYKFFDFAIALPTFFMNSLYPTLLTLSHRAFVAKMRRTLIILFILSFAVLIPFWVGAPFLVFIRRDFAPSIVFLRLLSLSIPVFFLTSPLMWLFIISKKQKLLIWVYASGLLFNMIGNLMVVPHYGAIGSSIMTGLSELLVLVIGYWWVRKEI